ncbi:MAG TPA: potassium transporter Kup [Kofleriaceae bacterium]|nr:potassium transporter Kup [Kofleriaceae bacterium]
MSDGPQPSVEPAPEPGAGQGHGHGHHRTRSRAEIIALALGALGVVYGDIGTSPLYAMRECFDPALPHSVEPDVSNVLGVLSLVFWALVLVVAVKYVSFIMRADNDGEGGIMALFALVRPPGSAGSTRTARGRLVLMMMGLFGAGLLCGEGVITPAISVLGAVEGIGVRAESMQPTVVPITVGILVALFLVQRRGTGGMGRLFGPVTMVWFIVIGVAGVPPIIHHPYVLAAVNPGHAVEFFMDNGWFGFFVLGSVVLVITGSEALYADMGHFGKTPIRIAWFAVVMPSLLLNYFGQGAMLLSQPEAAANPFYALAPGWTLYPMIGIATAAAVIASQALISGLFSITRQAMQLGYLPRLRVIHTSETEMGQIYIPEVNYMLMVGSVVLVLAFGSASSLAAAYGLSVTGTMIITSILFQDVARNRMGWKAARAYALAALFLIVDVSFFAANGNKLAAGGWFPLALGATVFTVMITWRRGRGELGKLMSEQALPLDLFLADMEMTQPHRVPGAAVFMTSNVEVAPVVLLHHVKHNKVLHERVVLLSVVTDRVPKVRSRDSLEVRDRGHGFWQVIAHVGFMQDAHIMDILAQCKREGMPIDLPSTSFYLGRETLLTGGKAVKMARWRKILFAFLSRNARSPTDFFGLPPNRVVELGAQIEL